MKASRSHKGGADEDGAVFERRERELRARYDVVWGKIMIENWALTIASLLLVGVTTYYAIQTRKTVGEMKKAREAEFLPHLKLSIVFLGAVNIFMRIVNVGKGPAMNVKV